MDITILLICLLNVYQVYGTKCYVCNSEEHPGFCGREGNFTEENAQHIADCNGNCYVGTLIGEKREAHLRRCLPNKITGCEKKESGSICQCGTDFCNKDLITCYKQNINILRCKQALKPVQMTQTSDRNQMAPKTSLQFFVIIASVFMLFIFQIS
ncbi:Hypothetical predicted protein [Mytilus galloprovincialis]|uniref:Uncharacterized protein n=1 Tax=Mytilus galloprovincialis TaxID=29158 RepID=A0A8B6C8Q4_MYTGA|nr:Hypothetical predicted protein [Mytilus galloprovincialis]